MFKGVSPGVSFQSGRVPLVTDRLQRILKCSPFVYHFFILPWLGVAKDDFDLDKSQRIPLVFNDEKADCPCLKVTPSF